MTHEGPLFIQRGKFSLGYGDKSPLIKTPTDLRRQKVQAGTKANDLSGMVFGYLLLKPMTLLKMMRLRLRVDTSGCLLLLFRGSLV